MAYKDADRTVGKQIKVGPNTKGTGTRGVPAAMSQLSKTKTAPATENPSKGGLTTVGRNIEPLDDLGKRKTIKTKI